jgi:hypothetical protein
MKRFFVSTFSLLALTSPAIASQTVTMGRDYGTYCRLDWAGEYQLTFHSDSVPGLAMESPFPSFSIEMGAEVDAVPATTDDVVAGDPVTSTGNALTPEAAYLYRSFGQGMLVSRHDDVRGLEHGTSTRVLRAATWFAQGERGNLLDILNADSDWHPMDSRSLEYAWANESSAESQDSEWTSTGDDRMLILSFWTDGEAPADNQGMLVVLVPAPGAVALGALGLGMLGWFRRRPGV